MPLSLVDKLKLLSKLNTAVDAVQKGIQMKDSTKVIGAIIAFVTAVLQIGSIQSAVIKGITTHPSIALILGGLSTILALIHVPVKTAMKALLLCALLSPLALTAQGTLPAPVPVAPVPAPGPASIQNFYAAGVSFNNAATPAIAGTGLYAHAVGSSGTYAFTAIDVLPNTLKPFTVTSNIGVGVAQKVTTIAGIPIFVPTAVGVSWTGSNTGWQWNAGAFAPFKIKKTSYYLAPTVRVVKSSVSGGTGYQPIIGVLFGWGQ